MWVGTGQGEVPASVPTGRSYPGYTYKLPIGSEGRSQPVNQFFFNPPKCPWEVVGVCVWGGGTKQTQNVPQPFSTISATTGAKQPSSKYV